MAKDKSNEFARAISEGREFIPTPEFEEQVLARKLQVKMWRTQTACYNRQGDRTPLEFFRENGVYDPPPWLGWSVPETHVTVRYTPSVDAHLCDCPYWMHELYNNE